MGPSANTRPESPTVAAKPGRRWLLFVHQLPSTPSNLRVRTWRRLQQLGAVPVKQAVYVLPDTPDAREDFEWLKTEVKAAGGDAIVVRDCVGQPVGLGLQARRRSILQGGWQDETGEREDDW